MFGGYYVINADLSWEYLFSEDGILPPGVTKDDVAVYQNTPVVWTFLNDEESVLVYAETTLGFEEFTVLNKHLTLV